MGNFLQRMKYSMQRFMQGRYGSDKLNFTILVIAILFDLIGMFTVPSIFGTISTILLVLAIYRMMSKNIQKRYAEGQKFDKFIKHMKELKTYHFYHCPQCKQKIRIPRKGGKKVEIRCPKCNTTFIKKI